MTLYDFAGRAAAGDHTAVGGPRDLIDVIASIREAREEAGTEAALLRAARERTGALLDVVA